MIGFIGCLKICAGPAARLDNSTNKLLGQVGTTKLGGDGQRAASQSDALLLLDSGIGQGLGDADDGEIRGCGAIDDRRNDAGRQEGEGSQHADVPFALGLPFGNPGEGGNSAEPDILDPSTGLAIAVSKASGPSGLIAGFAPGS
jgi:hypothetical protein